MRIISVYLTEFRVVERQNEHARCQWNARVSLYARTHKIKVKVLSGEWTACSPDPCFTSHMLLLFRGEDNVWFSLLAPCPGRSIALPFPSGVSKCVFQRQTPLGYVFRVFPKNFRNSSALSTLRTEAVAAEVGTSVVNI